MRGPPEGLVQQISELFGIAYRESRCSRFSGCNYFLFNPHVHHRATLTVRETARAPARGISGHSLPASRGTLTR